MARTYTYEPEKIEENGKDRMRFELGDTMIEGGSDTTALSDEEINAILKIFPNRWSRAKLALLESLCRRFAYEPDTKTGPLSFSFGERAKLWREDYEKLKASVGTVSAPKFGNRTGNNEKSPYFYTGIMENREAGEG